MLILPNFAITLSELFLYNFVSICGYFFKINNTSAITGAKKMRNQANVFKLCVELHFIPLLTVSYHWA
jgi:hypothetical protein